MPDFTFDELDQFTVEKLNMEALDDFSTYLANLNKHYIRQYNDNSDAKDQLIRSKQTTEESKTAFNQLRNDYENESLSDLVTNKNEFSQITEFEGELIQRADPIFNYPDQLSAHFYAPKKMLFGRYVSTMTVNVLVLWFMSLALAITLYFDAFKRFLDLFTKLDFLKKKK